MTCAATQLWGRGFGGCGLDPWMSPSHPPRCSLSAVRPQAGVGGAERRGAVDLTGFERVLASPLVGVFLAALGDHGGGASACSWCE